MNYTIHFTLLCSFFVASVQAQFGDSLVLVPADYLAQLESMHKPNTEDFSAEVDLSAAFLDGEEKVALFDYSIEPMYFTQHLQLSLPNEENFVMEIKDEEGQVVMSHQQMYGDNQLNLSHLAPGVYVVKLTCAMGIAEDTVIKL